MIGDPTNPVAKNDYFLRISQYGKFVGFAVRKVYRVCCTESLSGLPARILRGLFPKTIF